MMKRDRKEFKISKVYPDVYEKEKQLARELSMLQKDKVSVPELRRRIINIPNLKKVLEEDALKKRVFGK